ncbi:MAG: hypothetical protein ACI8XW_003338 [Gammaproteobacteria bacterium]|jgi:hypothetical protein
MSISEQVWLNLDGKARRRARRFHYVYYFVMILATPRAIYLYLLLYIRTPAGIAWLRELRLTPWRTMLDITSARLVRKIQLLTGWTASPVIVWPKSIPPSCVIAYFYSNWDVIIACEFANRGGCLVRTSEHWARRLGTQYVAGKTPLRTLVRSVIEGSRCGVLWLEAGKPIEVPEGDVGYKVSLNFAGQFFEYAIQRDPASWRKFFPFLMHIE